GVAAETEGRLHYRVGFGEGLVDRADVEFSFKTEIVSERLVDHRSFVIERGFRIGDDRQFLVTYLDQLAGIFRLGACARDDGANRFTLPARAFDRDRDL